MSGGATSEMRVQASSASGHTSTLQAARHMRAAEQLSRAPAGTDKKKQIYLVPYLFRSNFHQLDKKNNSQLETSGI